MGIFIFLMRPGIIIRYKASAGSGKTFRLAGIYLEALFRDPLSYRSILAVTFTNKASAEMKERILNNLYLLASGEDSEYTELLLKGSGKSEKQLRNDASMILKQLLHDYSRFSVGTIDSFFQKVLRSFARESGLQAGFNVILDSDMILSQAVDELLKDAESDSKLLDWLIAFGHREITEGKSWNLRNKILSLGKEIFKEKYRILHDKGYIVEDKEQLKSAISDMYAFTNSFSQSLGNKASEALEVLSRNNVEADMLYKKSNSIKKFLELAVKDIPGISFNAMEEAADEEKYFTGKAPHPALQAALDDGLHEKVESVAREYRENIKLYRSVKLVLDNLYTLGILTDIAMRTRLLLNGQNKFLLSDAGDILRRIIASDQAPFIYEKMGNRYKNFMIDEFQDTSRVQWDNFLPLINNSIAEGDDSLVVGDIKQSIYRWRNSDWEIFERIGENFHSESFNTIPLDKNWRSASSIIKFNNAVFSALPAMVAGEMNHDAGILTRVYSDVRQKDPGKHSGGYVRMKVYEDENARQDILDELPAIIEEIQDNGYSACDIGILVRTKNEGQEVIERITQYASAQENNSKYSYQVISQDSLMLDSSPVIVFLVSVLKYMVNRDDMVNYAVMYQHYLLSVEKGRIERPLFVRSDKNADHGSGLDVDDFENFLNTIRYLSVYEIIDRLIDYAGLNMIDSAIPYMTTLQNSVLEFAGTETNDIPAFLEWWDNEGHARSVSSTEQSDAMQLMTIHKSKGLQFKVVVLPFISWTFAHERPPFLWIYSDKNPLSRLGAVPVKMKKDFLDTYFADYYLEEAGKAAIDKLNMLYVAFTRARECLYGNLLITNKRKTAGYFLRNLFLESSKNDECEFDKYFNIETATFSYGNMPQVTAGDEPANADNVIAYPLNLDDDRLRLRLHSESFFTSLGKPEKERRYYGLLMHEILASVNTSADIDAALLEYLDKGALTYNDYLGLKEKLSDALKNEKVREWFSEDARIRKEKDILVPGEGVKRPDRIIFSDDRVIIVDFKFGREMPGHRKQVGVYRKILTDMGYQKVEAYLWYVDQSKVVEL